MVSTPQGSLQIAASTTQQWPVDGQMPPCTPFSSGWILLVCGVWIFGVEAGLSVGTGVARRSALAIPLLVKLRRGVCMELQSRVAGFWIRSRGGVSMINTISHIIVLDKKRGFWAPRVEIELW